MKVLAILGSRNPEGQTAQAVNALLSGVEAEGGAVERLFLPEKDIQRCRQCTASGWGTCRQEGMCIIHDDLAGIAAAIRAAEAVVFATPVYFGDLSESMRAFLDRLRRVSRPSGANFAGKKAVGICVAGGGGGGAPSAVVSLEKILVTCGFDVVDLIPARRQNLDHKKVVLEITGRWLAGLCRAGQ
ncbi:MAG TPA: flavodoxin family protein [Firmicutes bacterium]|nr:flavodoxin family protein [Bacillota bacterium]